MRACLFVLMFAILLTGCAGGSPAVPTAAPAAATATAAPLPEQPTPPPTATPPAAASPTREPFVTPAPTATATIVPTPTADPALGAVELTGLGWLDNYDMLLSLEFPAPVNPADYRVTLAEKDFSCEVIAQYPNRLYCRGQGARVLAETAVRVYAAGSTQPGFEKDVWIPFFTNSYNWPNE